MISIMIQSMESMTTEAEAALHDLGAQLKLARLRRGLSGRELAKRLGVDRRTLAQLESGKPTVSLGVFIQALGVLDLLRGLNEVLRPENDLEAVSMNIRRLRRRLEPGRPIRDDKVDF